MSVNEAVGLHGLQIYNWKMKNVECNGNTGLFLVVVILHFINKVTRYI